MDGFYSNNSSHSSRNLKLKGLTMSGSISQRDSALIKYLCSGSPSSGSSDVFTTPISKYQYGSGGFSSRGGSPLSSVENMERSPVFGAPVKVEEDVLVMDGILVGSVPGGRSTARSASDSGSSGSSGKSTYKKEICRAWEDSSNCRFGSKCQFAHGKEELRPSRFLNKNKTEVHMEKSISTITGSSSSSSTKCRPAKQIVPAPIAIPERPAAATKSESSQSPTKSEAQDSKTISSLPQSPSKSEAQDSKTISGNWSPYDDGIEISMDASSTDHKPPSREEVDARIESVLYGPSTKQRLPVFDEICPE